QDLKTLTALARSTQQPFRFIASFAPQGAAAFGWFGRSAQQYPWNSMGRFWSLLGLGSGAKNLFEYVGIGIFIVGTLIAYSGADAGSATGFFLAGMSSLAMAGIAWVAAPYNLK